MLSQIARGVLVLLGGVIVAHSQVEVTLQLPFAQQMPPQVAEWRENESLIRVVVQNTGRERYTGLMISAELQRDGRRIATTRNGHPAQPRFDLSPGEVRTLSWREVIAEPAIEYDRSIAEMVMTSGELPAGNYQLCLQVLDARLRPIGRPGCGTFTIILADPPVLLSPIRGVQAPVMPLLQWTPSTPPAPGLQYRVTLKVRYQGQTPAQAMASNPIRLQVDVPATSYQVPVTEQLGPDATDPNYAGHVWQVQALLNGRPYGRNRGLSQIEWFTVPPMAVDPVKPTNQFHAVVWDIPYEDLLHHGATISATLPKDAPDTLLYVLRLRIPKQLDTLWRTRYTGGYYLYRGASGDTAGQVSGVYPGGYYLFRGPRGDTARVQYYAGGFYLYRVPGGDTAGVQMDKCVDDCMKQGLPKELCARLCECLRDPWKCLPWNAYGAPGGGTGEQVQGYIYNGYFLYRVPGDTLHPAELVEYAKDWLPKVQSEISQRQIAYNAGKEGAIIVGEKDLMVAGTFTPAVIGLPCRDVVIEPAPDGDVPPCDLPPGSGSPDDISPRPTVCWPNGKGPGKPFVWAINSEENGAPVITYVWMGHAPKKPIKAVIRTTTVRK